MFKVLVSTLHLLLRLFVTECLISWQSISYYKLLKHPSFNPHYLGVIMALHTTNMHTPKLVNMGDQVADFWAKDAAAATVPAKHTLQPIVTGKMPY